jgi:mannose-1-phosphate guanylyltransferase
MSDKKVTQAVIMVGGKGTRLRPLTDNRPKPVLPVLDRPCLSYLIESFVEAGIVKIFLACGYRSEILAETIGDGSEWGISIEYSYEDEPMGTGGAIKLLEKRLDDTFVAANGDVFADMTLSDEIKIHFDSGASVTMALTPVPNPCEFGIARTDGEGRILEFREKPRPEEVFSNLINAGIYVVEKKVLGYIPENSFFDFAKDLMPLLMEDGHTVQSYLLDGVWRDVGRPSDLLGANMIMAMERYRDYSWNSSAVCNTVTTKPFYIGEGAAIKDSSASATVISKGCRVCSSKITNSLFMKGCSVESAEIQGSILGENCKVSPGAKVGSSVLADTTEVGCGIKIENNIICR